MARESGGRELVRGLVAAVIVLAMLLLGVRTMVGRMSERAVGDSRGTADDESAGARGTTGTDPSGGSTTGHGPIAPIEPPPGPAPLAPLAPPGTGATTGGTPSPSGVPVPSSDVPPGPTGTVHHGTLDAMQVRQVVRDALPEIRFCFEWELNAHPDLAGRVTMAFTINEDGTVADASVLEDALHDDTVTRCFTHVMGNLRFPPPEGGSVQVHYPFSLTGAPEAQRPEGI